jgi:hypothetical protein
VARAHQGGLARATAASTTYLHSIQWQKLKRAWQLRIYEVRSHVKKSKDATPKQSSKNWYRTGTEEK